MLSDSFWGEGRYGRTLGRLKEAHRSVCGFGYILFGILVSRLQRVRKVVLDT